MANFTPLGGLNLPVIENWLSALITQTMGSIWPPANQKKYFPTMQHKIRTDSAFY